jgi:hypothetical protein
MKFLGITDKFYRSRVSDDPFEHTLPWYDTVNMIIGVRQGEDAEDQVTSILLFQAVIGELQADKSEGHPQQDMVVMPILDYFSREGKNVPEHEVISLILHLACSEIKSAGLENLIAFSRVTESVLGGRKAIPSTIPKFLLDRLGFCSTASCQMALECDFFR